MKDTHINEKHFGRKKKMSKSCIKHDFWFHKKRKKSSETLEK